MNYTQYDTKFLIQLRDTLEREYLTLKNIVEDKKDNLDYLTSLINRVCNHEWVEDTIDQIKDYKLSQKIKYCSKCSLTNNT